MRTALLCALLLLGACTTIPSGPGVLVLPGTGKSFDEFRANDMECRQYASSQLGGSAPNDAATDNAVRNAAIGTAVGAAAGALLGGSRGAGAGAAGGLVVGSVSGAGSGDLSGRALQQRYDFSYQQCMYARGNRVPVSGRFDSPPAVAPVHAPAPTYAPPPPPPPGYVQPPR